MDRRLKRDLLDGRIPSYEVEVRYLGRPLYATTHVQDISERKKLAERLTYQVDHDFLTGLSNRRRFEQELARETRRSSRYGSGCALLLIDLDHFKDVNDALGHRAGDDLLKDVALALRRRMRQTDVLARVGGDEFAVLLPQTGEEEARIVAAGIVDTLRQRLAAVGGPSIAVTASVGVALFDGLPPEEVLARADLAMYDAKAAGRGRFAAPTPQLAGAGATGSLLLDADLCGGQLPVFILVVDGDRLLYLDEVGDRRSFLGVLGLARGVACAVGEDMGVLVDDERPVLSIVGDDHGIGGNGFYRTGEVFRLGLSLGERQSGEQKTQ
jgi:diguanylate cyclase (GGDEF)-like protein